MSAEEIFSRIYSTNLWGDPESRSGPGSSVLRTRLIRPALTDLCRDFGVRSLLDLPCGDFNWMRWTDLDGIDYTGGDIVSEIVKGNQQKYGSASRRFLHLDMVRDSLPFADVILCRDGLVHLSFADIFLSLERMQASQSKYILATTFRNHVRNEDIDTGGWRPLNLQISPFWFPTPVCSIWDGPRADGTYADKFLELYKLDDLTSRWIMS